MFGFGGTVEGIHDRRRIGSRPNWKTSHSNATGFCHSTFFLKSHLIICCGIINITNKTFSLYDENLWQSLPWKFVACKFFFFLTLNKVGLVFRKIRSLTISKKLSSSSNRIKRIWQSRLLNLKRMFRSILSSENRGTICIRAGRPTWWIWSDEKTSMELMPSELPFPRKLEIFFPFFYTVGSTKGVGRFHGVAAQLSERKCWPRPLSGWLLCVALLTIITRLRRPRRYFVRWMSTVAPLLGCPVSHHYAL